MDKPKPGLATGLGHWLADLSLLGQLSLGGLVALALWFAWGFWAVELFAWRWSSTAKLPSSAASAPSSTVGPSLQDLGQAGDLFGGINALFAAFAFVGVAIAAYYQHKTFRLQVEQDVRQSFEPLFFKLLDRHKTPGALRPRFTDELSNRGDTPLKDCMDKVRNLMLQQMNTGDTNPDLSFALELWANFYLHNSTELEPYFRNLYHLFKFIAFSQLPANEKVQHANIARAGLNDSELLLVAFNCTTEAGAEFKPLVEGFGLLKHLWLKDTSTVTPDRALARAYYSPTATMSAAEREKHWAAHPRERPHWLSSSASSPSSVA